MQLWSKASDDDYAASRGQSGHGEAFKTGTDEKKGKIREGSKREHVVEDR